MRNVTTKAKPMQAEKRISKKRTHISVEFKTMMPSEYTAYERLKLREFEKTVMGNRSVNSESRK